MAMTSKPDTMRDLVAAALPPSSTPDWVVSWLAYMGAFAPPFTPILRLTKDADGHDWVDVLRGDGLHLYAARMR